MSDLKSARLICVKGGLFLVAGTVAAVALLMENPSWTAVTLLASAVWCYARFYYFAFHVVQGWVDPTYRFSGLTSLVRHAMTTARAHRRRRA